MAVNIFGRLFLSLLMFLTSLATAQSSSVFVSPMVIPEWEPAAGVFVSFPFRLPDQLVKDFASDTKMYVLVEKTDRTKAREKLDELGVPDNRYELVGCSVDSEWPRDWGPHQVLDAKGMFGIVDPDFDGYPAYRQAGGKAVYTFRPGKGDDKVNNELGSHFSVPVDHCPAFVTGGNFLVDGFGTAFCTEAILEENRARYDCDELAKLLKTELGIERLIILKNTESVGIQHIDCWMKVLDAGTLLIKKAPAGHFDEKFLEQNVDTLSKLKSAFGKPYKIVRIDCPRVKLSRGFRDADPIAAYTNSLILNDKVYVPLFNCDGDQAALETWRTALPGYEVKGYLYDKWMDFDALHCRSRALFERERLNLIHVPLHGTVKFSSSGYEIKVNSRSKPSNQSTIVGKLFYRQAGKGDWTEIKMARSNHDSWVGSISFEKPGVSVEYYLSFLNEGKNFCLPPIAPKSYYEFEIRKD